MSAFRYSEVESAMLFAPWGDYGRQYRIENEAQVRSIEQGVKAFGVAALPLVCALLLIAILRRRLPAAVLGWSLLVIFVSLAIAVTTFAIWARLISGRLTQADTVSLVTSSASAAARLTLQAQPQVPPCDVVGTARGILRNLTADLRDSHGVGAESLLASLGALGGFACQIAVRRTAAENGDQLALAEVVTDDGRRFCFGDALNARLSEDADSFWRLLVTLAAPAGRPILDETEIHAHVAATIGSPLFGLPRMPDHKAGDTPESYVRAFWPAALVKLEAGCPDPRRWPEVMAYAAGEAVAAAEPVIDRGIALRMVMECAVPMSKLDPAMVA